MTRIMQLAESTRVNMLNYAVRGFPTTRGPDNLRTVCEIAALSSVDPVFIAEMLQRVPHPESCLADWSFLALKTDHEVMMEVLVDRFGLNVRTARVPSEWTDESGNREMTTFEQALIRHDAVRVLTTAVHRGWVDPTERHRPAPYRGDWSRRAQPWLVHALGAKAPRIAEQLMTYDAVARDPQHLAEALHDLSIDRHEHDGQHREFATLWWHRLLQAGADPWLLDEHSQLPGAPSAAESRVEGATPGHRMLRHALSQMGDSRFRGDGQRWLAMLQDSLTWAEAPVVHGQTLPAFALAHPKVATGGSDGLAIAEALMEGFARQGTPLDAASPDANPVELLLAPYLALGKPYVPTSSWGVSMLDRDKPPEPLLFDRAFEALKPWREAFPDGTFAGPAVERLAQKVVGRLEMSRSWADAQGRSPYSSQPVSDDDRQKKNDEWREWVRMVHDRLQRLDRWVVPAARPDWQAWVQDWHSTCITWPDVPDAQAKEEAARRNERLALNAAFLATAGTAVSEPRLRNRL